MKLRFHLFFVAVVLSGLLGAQGVRIADTPGQPDPSAGLEVDYTDRGFLPPRMTAVQRNAIANPAQGLVLYNTTSNCLEIRHGNGWQTLSCQCPQPPSAQFSFSPGQPGTGQAVQFNAGSGGLSYAWQFASGTPASSVSQSPSVTWAQAGTYSVVLQVTDNNGCTASDTQSVTVTSCGVVTGSATFNYTGSAQTWVVPTCVTSITVEMWGASGGGSSTGGSGQSGRGGYVTGDLSVSPGETYYVYVGQQGGVSYSNGGPTSAAFNGGGYGNAHGYPTPSGAAGGGGASDLRYGGQNLSDRIMVAGGGGGGHINYDNNRRGGPGGNVTAGNGGSNNGITAGGTGGSQTSGGVGGQYNGAAGSLGQGGHGVGDPSGGGPCCAAGGGGGYYGGGGGNHSGAGGGSSYISGYAGCIPQNHASGKIFSNSSMQQGQHHGNGQVIISW